MNITLKNIKHNEKLSRDSHCFSATVYVDGKKVFGVMDDGWGGFCLETYKVKGGVEDVAAKEAEIDAYLGAEKREGYDHDNELMLVVYDLVNQFLQDREIKKNLRRITFMEGDKMLEVKMSPTPENLTRIKAQKWWKDSYVVLNGMPIEEVRQYFK